MAVTADAQDRQCVETLQEIETLYAAQAVRLRRLVHLRVVAPDSVVEDACQVAWLRLVRHHDRVRRTTVRAWLVQVATREALRLLERGSRDEPLVDLESAAQSTPDLVEAFTEHRTRLEEISALPERQRRLLWLRGLGFSYEEMARATGESHRTIERQLARARERLARS